MTALLSDLCCYCIFQALALLLLANGAPIIVNKLLGERWAQPIDNGFMLNDGQRLLGQTKTWRGFYAALCLTTLGALLFELNAWIGMAFGVLSMTGDLLSSFIKRRRAKVESSQARGFDTVPESLLPVWFLQSHLGLGLIEIALIVGFFFLIEEYLSPILYKLQLRKRPY